MPNLIAAFRFPAAAAVLVLAAVISGGAFAQNPVMTLVVAPTAVVHAEPTVGSDQLGSIKAEDVVLAFTVKDDWVKVEFQAADGTWKAGWVMRDALRLKKALPEAEETASSAGPGYTAGKADTYENGFGAVYDLNLDHAALDCARDAEVGFSSCDVVVQASMVTTFNGAREPRVQFLCETDLVATDKSGGARKVTAEGRGEIIGRGGIGEARMFANLYAEVAVRQVRIGDVRCRITGVIE